MGSYIVVRKLGIGGIGAVYLAQHQLLKQVAAIKVHDYFPADLYVGTAFFRASNYLSQLDHPHIVRLYDYGYHNGRAYQAMEYIIGTTLAEHIPRQQTQEWLTRCLEFFAQMLSALYYAHNCQYRDIDGTIKRGMIHGDIKPHNFLLDNSTDSIKLADFMIPDVQAYLGRINPDFSQIIHASQIFGTPAYMSPEQTGGQVTQQTDIFSLGVTMYQLVTGFETYSINEMTNMWWNYTPPQQVNPYLPAWLDDMIMNAIQKDPGQRYQTVAEMLRIFTDNQTQAKSHLTINIGDISNISGQIFIGDFNNVVANLNTMSQTDIAEALKIVKEAVMASNDLSDSKKKEQIEIISLIGSEAAKPIPNRAYFRTLVDGLVANLKNVPVLANVITEITLVLTKSK